MDYGASVFSLVIWMSVQDYIFSSKIEKTATIFFILFNKNIIFHSFFNDLAAFSFNSLPLWPLFIKMWVQCVKLSSDIIILWWTAKFISRFFQIIHLKQFVLEFLSKICNFRNIPGLRHMCFFLYLLIKFHENNVDWYIKKR